MGEQIILKCDQVSKQYRLGLVGTGTLSHDLNRFWHKIRGKEDPYLKIGSTNVRSATASSDYVWALRDINFEVKEGEILGIIGKNGAGKSTLLKILSRVTAPTQGNIQVGGRIASLLEVGTGMHPELTGRENIFLNGAILGMTKEEIASKIDEIINFSGCEMFIDTPVKRYSSGMRVRLGFAVAAFLEPDILIVDEVLAVGDAEFQKKAIGKMKNISSSTGRTVLFVSHNMAAVKSMCTRCIVLEDGKIAFEGGTDESVDYYLKSGNEKGSEYLRFFDSSEFDGQGFQIIKLGVKASTKDYGDPIIRNDEIVLDIEFENNSEEIFRPSLRFKDEDGNFIFVASPKNVEAQRGNQTFKMIIPNRFLNQGSFFADIQVSDGKRLLYRAEDVISFTVIQEKIKLGQWMGKTAGPLKPDFNWERF